ncbi:MAG: hypothetical protein Q4Q20_03190 [Methanocorpusculum sp.]|nr:hypothetical protein [Methanocorpusculum sp.]
MDNRELFEEGPKLIKCDGCSRYFEEQMLKQCRACGKSFCPECRLTHDCRETAAGREVPPVIIRSLDKRSSAGSYGAPAQTDEAHTPYHHIELTFIDADGSSIGGASLREKPSFGSSHQYDSEGRSISFNDPADVSIRSADLKRYDDAKVYGDDRYSAPAPAPQAVYPPQPQYAPPEPQYVPPQPQYVPPMPPYTPEHAAPAAAAFSQPPQQSPGFHPEEYSITQQSRATADTLAVPPKSSYYAPVIDTVPVPAEDELRCDDCGKIWKKSQLRRCKKCGAVLCPECREKHKCGKKQKETAHHAADSPVRRESGHATRPRKEHGGKKANKKLILMLVVLLIFMVALAIAIIMLVQNGGLTLPEFSV